jgi:hypothetical protein
MTSVNYYDTGYRLGATAFGKGITVPVQDKNLWLVWDGAKGVTGAVRDSLDGWCNAQTACKIFRAQVEQTILRHEKEGRVE